MSTQYRGSRRERRALDVFIKFMRASDSVRSRLEPTLVEFGVTGAQFGILETLLFLGPAKPSTLATKRLVTRGNITSVLNVLERDGLVRRTASPHDGRERIVRLTPRGRRLVKRVFPITLADIVEEFGVLSAHEQQELARLSKKLGRASS